MVVFLSQIVESFPNMSLRGVEHPGISRTVRDAVSSQYHAYKLGAETLEVMSRPLSTATLIV